MFFEDKMSEIFRIEEPKSTSLLFLNPIAEE